MKIIALLLFSVCTISLSVKAQKNYVTRNGKVSFLSADDDDIKAVNNEVTSRISDKGEVSFSLLVKGFRFDGQEMQDHFNNSYIESTKYPRSDFKGQIVNVKEVNFAKNGSYPIVVKGSLTMHGVTREVTAKGAVTVQNGKLSAKASLPITLEQFNITGGLIKAITKGVTISIDCHYQ